MVQPIEATQAWGYDAQHLRLRIQEKCGPDDIYRVAETPRGTRGINYGSQSTGVVIDFWVLDVDGATVVVDTWHQGGSSVALVDSVARAAVDHLRHALDARGDDLAQRDGRVVHRQQTDVHVGEAALLGELVGGRGVGGDESGRAGWRAGCRCRAARWR